MQRSLDGIFYGRTCESLVYVLQMCFMVHNTLYQYYLLFIVPLIFVLLSNITNNNTVLNTITWPYHLIYLPFYRASYCSLCLYDPELYRGSVSKLCLLSCIWSIWASYLFDLHTNSFWSTIFHYLLLLKLYHIKLYQFSFLPHFDLL